MRVPIIIFIVIGAFFAYLTYRDNPKVLQHPVYLEAHVFVAPPGIARRQEYVLIGEMVSLRDCRQRMDDFVQDVIGRCAFCSISRPALCTAEIPAHYADPSAGGILGYLDLTRRNRFARNGRLLFRHLGAYQAMQVCERVRKAIAEGYSGTAHCVAVND